MVKVVECDLFEAECQIIAHGCNCQGTWGATGGTNNVALQMREKFPLAYRGYRRLCKSFKLTKSSLLGTCQLLIMKDGTRIANLFTQLDYGIELY